MPMPIVSITRCRQIDKPGSVKKALLEAIDLIGGLSPGSFKGDSVLIKPNILVGRPYKTGATTNPYVIGALIDILRDHGISKIVIGEGSIVGKDTSEAFKECGIDRLAASKKVGLVDLKKDDFVQMDIPGGKIIKSIKIPGTIIDSDLIINVPVMKTHDSFPATLGLKNIKGVIHENDKKRFHHRGLAQCITDLNKIVLPHLTIMDATVGMEGLGPIYGSPVDLGLILASFDTVAVDTVSAQVMGMDPDSIEYIKLAAEQGLGTGDTSRIKIAGNKISAVKKVFKRAEIELKRFREYGIRILEGGACSGCRHTLETYLIKLETKGQALPPGDITFLLGTGPDTGHLDDMDGKIFKFGACTRSAGSVNDIYIPGCPPHVETIREIAKKYFKGHH